MHFLDHYIVDAHIALGRCLYLTPILSDLTAKWHIRKFAFLYAHVLTHRTRLFLTDSPVQGFMLLVSPALTSVMMMMLVCPVSLFLLSLCCWGPLQRIFPQIQLCPSSRRSQRGSRASHGTAVHDGLWDRGQKKWKDKMRALKAKWNGASFSR